MGAMAAQAAFAELMSVNPGTVRTSLQYVNLCGRTQRDSNCMPNLRQLRPLAKIFWLPGWFFNVRPKAQPFDDNVQTSRLMGVFQHVVQSKAIAPGQCFSRLGSKRSPHLRMHAPLRTLQRLALLVK